MRPRGAFSRGRVCSSGDPAEHRQPERQRLAGPRLGPAEHVLAAEGIRQGTGLDREWLADVAGGKRSDQPRLQPKLGEGHDRRLRKLGGSGERSVQLGPGVLRRWPGRTRRALPAG